MVERVSWIVELRKSGVVTRLVWKVLTSALVHNKRKALMTVTAFSI
jgi:hypothetical protein